MTKYLPLVWTGLWRRPIRTSLTLLSIVTAFFLFGSLQGMNEGLNSVLDQLNVSRLRVSNRGNARQPLPVAHVEKIAALDGVASVTPLVLVFGSYRTPSDVLVPLGVNVETLRQIFPEFTLSSDAVQSMARIRNGLVAGAVIAEKYGWRVGDRVPIRSFNVVKADGNSDWQFEIAGIYDHSEHSLATGIFANYAYLDEARAMGRGTADQILARVANPERATEIARQIDAMFTNSDAQTTTQNEKDALRAVLTQVGDTTFVVNVISAAVLFALLFLTSNTMMQSTRERTPEFAVLRTIGFQNTGVMGLILTEALLIGSIAAIAGLALAKGAIPWILGRYAPEFSAVTMPIAVFAWGLATAVLLALISGVPPALRAHRKPIVDALAGR